MLFKKTVTLKKGGGIGKNDSEDEGGGRWKLKWRNIQSDIINLALRLHRSKHPRPKIKLLLKF